MSWHIYCSLMFESGVSVTLNGVLPLIFYREREYYQERHIRRPPVLSGGFFIYIYKICSSRPVLDGNINRY